MYLRTLGIVVVAASSFSSTGGAEISNWPGFRGPNGSGVSDSAKPPVHFGPKENVAWAVDLPGSPSSPCIWGDRIFLTTFNVDKLETRAYQRSDGKLLWTRVAPTPTLEEFHASEGSPASSTPATDGTTVVTYFGSCGLLAYDFNGCGNTKCPSPKPRETSDPAPPR
jgi:outer membrane protein assembly factor BamB